MTLAQMRARVRFFIDEPQQQNFSDADINIAINIAKDAVALEIVHANEDYFTSPVPTAVNLVPGTETYPLHVDANSVCDVLKIKRVEDPTTGLAIMPIDQNEKISSYTTPMLVIIPSPLEWYLVGNSIGFTPPPNAVATVNYWFVPRLPDMALDADTTQIPVSLHDMIPVRASIDAFVKDEADISQLRSLWNEYMDRLRRTIKDRQIQAPRHVRRAGDQLAGWQNGMY